MDGERRLFATAGAQSSPVCSWQWGSPSACPRHPPQLPGGCCSSSGAAVGCLRGTRAARLSAQHGLAPWGPWAVERNKELCGVCAHAAPLWAELGRSHCSCPLSAGHGVWHSGTVPGDRAAAREGRGKLSLPSSQAAVGSVRATRCQPLSTSQSSNCLQVESSADCLVTLLLQETAGGGALIRVSY